MKIEPYISDMNTPFDIEMPMDYYEAVGFLFCLVKNNGCCMYHYKLVGAINSMIDTILYIWLTYMYYKSHCTFAINEEILNGTIFCRLI